VVVATTADGVAAVSARIGDHPVEVVAPSAARRLVRAAVDDEWEAERLVETLRGDGQMAVARPADGVRLDAWMRHTRPLAFGDRLAVCFAWSEHDRAGLPTVRIELPPAGFAIYHASPSLHRLGPHPPADLKPWAESAWHGGIQRA